MGVPGDTRDQRNAGDARNTANVGNLGDAENAGCEWDVGDVGDAGRRWARLRRLLGGVSPTSPTLPAAIPGPCQTFCLILLLRAQQGQSSLLHKPRFIPDRGPGGVWDLHLCLGLGLVANLLK